MGEVDEHPTVTRWRRQGAAGRPDVIDLGAGRVDGAPRRVELGTLEPATERNDESAQIVGGRQLMALVRGERERQVVDGEVAVADGDHAVAGALTGAALEVHPWG